MAVSPSATQLETYRLVVDPTTDPETKRQAIDMLYGVPPPVAGPDLRTANATGDPRPIMFGSGDQPPAPPPVATDAGGMSVAPPTSSVPPTVVPTAASAGASVPDAAVSVPPPPAGANFQTASGESVVAPAPVVPGASSGRASAAPEQPADATDAGINAYLRAQMGGGRGRYVPAHDQPTSTVIERAGGVPDDLKTKIGVDAIHASARALERGEEEAKTHTDAALSADIQARDARQKEADLAATQKAQADHAQELDQGFEKLVRDTEVTPGSWWSSKSTGQKILSVISAAMLGLGHNPKAITEIIDSDIATRQANRDKLLGARRHAIDDFRAQMLSPEAANAAERALASQAVAAEATRLAEASNSATARSKALEIAAAHQSEFNKWMAEMAAKEAGASRTNIAHVPGQSVGGPKSLGQILKEGHAIGLNTEGMLRQMVGGAYAGKTLDKNQREQAESALGRTVVFPGNQKLYARDVGEAKSRQKAIDSTREILSAYDLLERLGSKPGHSISPTDLAKIQTTISRNLLNLKNSEELGAISATDMALIDPLSGGGTAKTFAWDDATRAGIGQARELLQQKQNFGKQSLFTEPFSNEHTGGTTAEEVELPQ